MIGQDTAICHVPVGFLDARPEDNFFDVKSQEFSSLLFTVTSTNGFYSPPLSSKSGLKLVCNVNIVHGNLKSENSQY